MSRTRPRCPAEFRARISELTRAGCMSKKLSREFEPSAHYGRCFYNPLST